MTTTSRNLTKRRTYFSANHTFPRACGGGGGGRWKKRRRSHTPPAACTRLPPRRQQTSCRGASPAGPCWHPPSLLAEDTEVMSSAGEEKALWSFCYISRRDGWAAKRGHYACYSWLPVYHGLCSQGKDYIKQISGLRRHLACILLDVQYITSNCVLIGEKHDKK